MNISWLHQARDFFSLIAAWAFHTSRQLATRGGWPLRKFKVALQNCALSCLLNVDDIKSLPCRFFALKAVIKSVFSRSHWCYFNLLCCENNNVFHKDRDWRLFDNMIVASSDKECVNDPAKSKGWKLFWATLNRNLLGQNNEIDHMNFSDFLQPGGCTGWHADGILVAPNFSWQQGCFNGNPNFNPNP